MGRGKGAAPGTGGLGSRGMVGKRANSRSRGWHGLPWTYVGTAGVPWSRRDRRRQVQQEPQVQQGQQKCPRDSYRLLRLLLVGYDKR